MTVEEAKLFFPYNEEDDLSDLYDERLFEYKQFFLAKTPIRKVFEAKLDKLLQMDKAYRVLANIELDKQQQITEEKIVFSDVILDAFNQWEQQKGMAKQQISIASEASSLYKTVNNYLHLVDCYRIKWYTDQEIDIEITQLSKDEDPMAVLDAIRTFKNEGGEKFEDILKMNSNSFLLKEMKRLSLLIKNYGNGRGF